jgi:hypothetical protein
MKKLTAYKQSLTDIETAKTQIAELETKCSQVSIDCKSLTLNYKSSKAQFIYAVSILMSKLNACYALGVDKVSVQEDLDYAVQLYNNVTELHEWNTYFHELTQYNRELFRLLTDEERFQLCEYPKAPKA